MLLTYIHILFCSVICITNAQFYSNNDTHLFTYISKTLVISEFENIICYEDIHKVINGIQNFELWALKLLDSSGKLGSGVLSGNIKMLGHYDQCVMHQSRDLSAQYCLATLQVNPSPQHTKHKEIEQLIDMATLGRAKYEIIKEEDRPIPDMLSTLSHIQFGVCLPPSCTNNDVQLVLNSALKYLENSTELQVSAIVPKNYCSVQYVEKWTPEDITFVSIIGLMISISIFSTFYFNNDTKKSDSTFLSTFSIRKNWNQLMRTDNPGLITSLDGIRVLSTLWVILSHKIGFYTQEPWVNKDKVFESVTNIASMPLINNMLPVDTFFTISGLLRGYTLWRELEGRKHHFISSLWKRYLRLTPPMSVMLGFYITLANKLGSGPYWYKTVTASTTEVCRNKWIYNLLYLNNYNWDNKFCVGQTWYLAADMHLFILAPLLIYPAWKWPNKAIKIFTTAMLIAILIPFFTILHTSVLPIYLPSASNADFIKCQSLMHLPTHQRAAGYIVGIICGIFLLKSSIKKLKLTKVYVTLGWIVSAISILGIIFGPYKYFQYDYKYDVLEMSIYGALHRPLWAVAIAWIIFACYIGYGGWINNLLSARIFLPISRLSYCIFLTHFIVLKISTGKIKTPLLVDEYDLIRQFIGDLFIIITSAIILHIFIEAPTLETVKLLQNSDFKISISPWMDWIQKIIKYITQKIQSRKQVLHKVKSK